jgi:hypothetical protein
MSPIHRAVPLIALVLLAAGCQAQDLRPWQQANLPTHNSQLAFQAAREVMAAHFEIAEASWTKGTIETRPQAFDGKRAGTLADVRGAGGRWRRIVSFELAHDESAVVGMVNVRLEREGTAQAVAIAQSGGDEGRGVEGPRSQPFASRPGDAVWTEVGRDDALARELLSEIAERIAKAEKGEALPVESSPQKEIDEARRLDDKP